MWCIVFYCNNKILWICPLTFLVMMLVLIFTLFNVFLRLFLLFCFLMLEMLANWTQAWKKNVLWILSLNFPKFVIANLRSETLNLMLELIRKYLRLIFILKLSRVKEVRLCLINLLLSFFQFSFFCFNNLPLDERVIQKMTLFI